MAFLDGSKKPLKALDIPLFFPFAFPLSQFAFYHSVSVFSHLFNILVFFRLTTVFELHTTLAVLY